MSNRVEIVRTKFTDLHDGFEIGGVRVFDEYSKEYHQWDDVPEDDMDLLVKAIDSMVNATDNSLEFAVTNHLSITIDDKTYDWVDYALYVKEH